MSLGLSNSTFKIVVNSLSNTRSVVAGGQFVGGNDIEDDVLDYEAEDQGEGHRLPDHGANDIPPFQNGGLPGCRGSLQSTDSLSDHDDTERSSIRSGFQEDALPAHREHMILGYRRYDPDYITLPDEKPIPRSLDSSDESAIMDSEDDTTDCLGLTNNDGYEGDLNLTKDEEDRLLRDDEDDDDGDKMEVQKEQFDSVSSTSSTGSTVRRAGFIVTIPPTKIRKIVDHQTSVHGSPGNDWNLSLPDWMRSGMIKEEELDYEEAHFSDEEEEKGGGSECSDGHDSDEQDDVTEEAEKRPGRAPSPPATGAPSPPAHLLFKAPFPPAKRPPTRPRRSPTGPAPLSVLAVEPPRSTAPEPHPEDDAISLTASVLEELDVESVVSEQASRVNETSGSEPCRAATNATPPKGLDYVRIFELQVFGGLCFNYFFGRCVRASCRYPHFVNQAKLLPKCKSVDVELLKRAYRFSLDYESLYRSMYEVFLVAFGFRKLRAELLDCLPDLFRMGVDLPHAIGVLLAQLKNVGLGLPEAVDSILCDDNLTKYPELGDVLVDVLTEMPDLRENFPLIRRVTLLRSSMPARLADKILTKILDNYPPDRNLCRDAYDLFFVEGMTDESALSQNFRGALETLRRHDGAEDAKPLASPTPLDVPVEAPTGYLPANRRCTELFPARPIVGLVRPGTIPERSLHRLISDFDLSTGTSIRGADVFALQNAVMKSDGRAFLQVFQRNGDVRAIESFAVMFISFVRNSPNVVDTLDKLLASLGSARPDYGKDVVLKIILEVTVMNLLVELDEGRKWSDAKVLIERFLDWDGIASSQVFSRGVTHVGRYVLLAKTLALGGNLFYAHEVLQCPALRLTEAPWPWPSVPSDEADRNIALEAIFKNGDLNHFPVIVNLYEKVLRNAEMRELFGDHFNALVRSLLASKRVPKLLAFVPSMDVFAEAMDHGNLRSYAVAVCPELSCEQLMALYELCCTRGIYTSFQGVEEEIAMRTDMCDEEVLMVLTGFFAKMSQRGAARFRDLRVCINLPGTRQPHRYYRSMQDVNSTVRRLLLGKFMVRSLDGPDLTAVVVPAGELNAFLLR